MNTSPMKPLVPAKRTENVAYAIRDLVPIAEQVEKTGKKVLYLNIGDPLVYDYHCPPHLWDAILKNKHQAEGYANAIGSPGARKAVANYAKRMGVAGVSTEDAITFVGASEAITIAFNALLNPTDNMLTPCPGYSLYTGHLNFLGSRLNEYDLDEKNQWQIDFDDLERKINPDTKGITVINPNNPTGGVYSKKTLKQLVNIAGEHNLMIFSDETYDQLVFDGEKFHSLASLANDVPVLSCGSISKNFLCPGFRGGWLYRHDPAEKMNDYFAAIQKLCRLRLSTVSFAQIAIEAALNGPMDHIPPLIQKLEKRRDLLVKRVEETGGLSVVSPKGAFYAFIKIDFPVSSDKEFVLSLLRQKGVLTVHGEGFGQKKGSHHFRIVFLPNEQILNSAFDQIDAFIRENHPTR